MQLIPAQLLQKLLESLSIHLWFQILKTTKTTRKL